MPSNNAPHLVASGDRFGRLTAIDFSHQDSRWRRHYLVKCDCGVEKTVQGTLLRSGNTKSCGCLVWSNAKLRALPKDKGVINQIILQYKRHAKTRGFPFKLNYEEVENLVRAPCFYCGNIGGNIKKTKSLKEGFRHNGIDRSDSAKPYESGNVVPCCGTCNMAKSDTKQAEFIAWAIRVANHQRAMSSQQGNL